MLTYHLLVWKDLAPKTRATKEKSSVDDNTEASEHAVGHVVKSERSAKHLAEYEIPDPQGFLQESAALAACVQGLYYSVLGL